MSSSSPKEMAGVVAESKDRSDAAVADQPATRRQAPMPASALMSAQHGPLGTLCGRAPSRCPLRNTLSQSAAAASPRHLFKRPLPSVLPSSSFLLSTVVHITFQHVASTTTDAYPRGHQVSSQGRVLGSLIVHMPAVRKDQD